MKHEEMPDTPCVLVRTDLRPSTYRAFQAEAKRRGVSIGEVLSTLADHAVHGPKVVRRRVLSDLDERIREMNACRMSDNQIGKELGMAQSTISKHRRALGIESPTPRRGGRQREEAS